MESRIDLLEKIASGEYSLGDQLNDNVGRPHTIVQCDWCYEPYLKETNKIEITSSSYCSRWCQGRSKTSEDIAEYDGTDRPIKWWNVRRKAWDRDNESCQNCGKPRGVIGRRPSVNLIDNELGISLENVVSLCMGCENELSGISDLKEAQITKPNKFESDLFVCTHSGCSPNSPDSWFETERAMKIHYGSTHEGSLSIEEVSCRGCNEVFEAYEYRERELCRSCAVSNTELNEDECPTCGDVYMSLGAHWVSDSGCDYPELDDNIIEILTGMVMGDATIQDHSHETKNCRLYWRMITDDFLEWLDAKLDFLVLGEYDLNQTPKESAESAVESGLTDQAEPENYNSLYANMTRAHPEFNWFGSWYDSGEKRFPLDEIDLTPLTLKVWFVCDGTTQLRDHRPPEASIACVNESDRLEDICEFIEDATGIEAKLDSDRGIRFNAEETKEFFEFIGDPLPGFEYKWPEEFR